MPPPEPTYTLSAWPPGAKHAASLTVPLNHARAAGRLAGWLGVPTPNDVHVASRLVDLAPSSVTLPHGTRITVDPA